MSSDFLAEPASSAPGHRTSRRYSHVYSELRDRYDGTSIDVSFRQLVGALPANEYTHGLYPYPARLLRHIPRFLLATDAVVDGIDMVFDPFVGSGTVLLEAQLRGIASLGVEQNPVAALVSRVKVAGHDAELLPDLLDAILSRAKTSRRPTVPSETLNRWYSSAALSALGRLLTAVSESCKQSDSERDVALLCLALTARKVATTDLRIPVPVRTTRNTTATSGDVWDAWRREAKILETKLSSLPRHRAATEVRLGDARSLHTWPTPDQAAKTLLLSSPPYGAAQKYVRSTSLEAGWLGHAPRGKTVHIEHDNIGREHLSQRDASLTIEDIWSSDLRQVLAEIAEDNPQRGAIYLAYFVDMQRVFANASARRIKRIALISGTNFVAGRTLHTNHHLAETLQSLGFRRTLSMRDPIRGRTLLTNRRNGTPSPAEYIDIFELDDNA